MSYNSEQWSISLLTRERICSGISLYNWITGVYLCHSGMWQGTLKEYALRNVFIGSFWILQIILNACTISLKWQHSVNSWNNKRCDTVYLTDNHIWSYMYRKLYTHFSLLYSLVKLFIKELFFMKFELYTIHIFNIFSFCNCATLHYSTMLTCTYMY